MNVERNLLHDYSPPYNLNRSSSSDLSRSSSSSSGEDAEPALKKPRVSREWRSRIFTATINSGADALHRLLDEACQLDGFHLDWTYGPSGFTPLQSAIHECEAEQVALLLKAGSDPNYYRVAPSLLLVLVSERFIPCWDSTDALQALVKAGADLTAVHEETSSSVLMYVCRNGMESWFEAVWGPATQSTLDLVDKEGYNALHYLAENEYLAKGRIIDRILYREDGRLFDMNVLDLGMPGQENAKHPVEREDTLISPLERAISFKSYSMALALLRHGATPFSRCLVAMPNRNYATAHQLQSILCKARALSEQAREEIITFGMYVFDPKLCFSNGPLIDVFPLILPHLWYRNRVHELFEQH